MDDTRKLPKKAENNVWWRDERQNAAIVFVHGVLSDSRSCWSTTRESVDEYWPQIVSNDHDFDGVDIFLGGYYTAIDSGKYEIRNAADELLAAMRRKRDGKSVLDRRFLLFICHSTGGIVVRYIINHNHEEFKNRVVGLILMASPSSGSSFANYIASLTSIYGNAIGQQLQRGSWSLAELDARFKALVYEKRIPNLIGVEACENHFVIHRKWLPDKTVVVTEDSAGRYFGPPIMLRNTNHFDIVKPSSSEHPAHQLLLDFWQQQFCPLSVDGNILHDPSPEVDISSFRALCLAISPMMQENGRIFNHFGPNASTDNKSSFVRHDLNLWYKYRVKIVENNERILNLLRENCHLIPVEHAAQIDLWISHIEAFAEHVNDENIDYRERKFPTSVIEIVRNETQ